METKRIFIATALCLAILLGWTKLSDYMGWTPPAPAPVEEVANFDNSADVIATQTQASANVEQNLPPAAAFAPQEGKEITIDTPLYTATIHSSGALLTSFTLKKYPADLNSDAPVEMISKQASLVSPMGILYSGQPSWHIGQWYTEAKDLVLSENQEQSLVFTGLINDITLKRTLTFNAETYLISEQLEVLSPSPATTRLSFTLASTSLTGPDNNYDSMKVVYDDGGLEEDKDVKDLTAEGLLQSATYNWAGLASNYFLAAVAPVSTSASTLKARIQNDVWRVALEESDILLQANQPYTIEAYWWFGPKERTLLDLAPQKLSSATDMGMFDIIARPMLLLMSFLYGFVGNWGLAIIILTILIKLVFWPLTRASFTSMQKMKRIQPMLKDLQAKHANDREALSREMMQLYRTYGVNPLGGCLPILVQIPVFFALYQALLQSLELRHSSFITYLPFTDIVWLADLSAKDPLYITPIIMGGTMFLQQLLTPAMGDPTQRKIMLVMPLVFTFMFLNFPSGLVLYWLMSNVFSILQQWYTLRKIK